jgi:Uri superfamily endonuclease
MCDRARSGGYALAEDLPHQSGAYALLLKPRQDVTITVGKLGTFHLTSGLYVYLGSAMGTGGIRARVSRHLRDSKRPHWHIDALTNACSVESVYWVVQTARLECAWTRALLNLSGSSTPIPGFGSSDCSNSCPAHLVQLSNSRNCWELATAIELSNTSTTVAGLPAPSFERP